MVQLSKALPACGFVIAVALVGITSSFKDAPKTKGGDPLYTFEYMPPTSGDYSAASVVQETNWKYTGDATRCTDDQEKACKIFVTASHVNGTTPSTYSLDASANVQATNNPSDPTEAYVSSTADGTGSTNISNQAD